MRLFLAIYPPKNVLDQLRDSVREFAKHKRNLKLTPIDQLHLTLKFIGPGVSERSKELISEALKAWEGSLGQVEVSIDKIQFGFPKQDFPTLLIAKAKSTDSLINLNTNVHSIFKELQLRDTINWKEKYDENFHVTLARLKKTATKSSGNEIKEKIKTMEQPIFDSFIGEEMYLVESIIEDNTHTYKKLEKIKL